MLYRLNLSLSQSHFSRICIINSVLIVLQSISVPEVSYTHWPEAYCFAGLVLMLLDWTYRLNQWRNRAYVTGTITGPDKSIVTLEMKWKKVCAPLVKDLQHSLLLPAEALNPKP